MTVFRYQAQSASGVRQRGTLEAANARQARQQLREQGLQVLMIELQRQTPFAAARRVYSLSLARRCLLTRQLATLLQAGMPLTEALHAVAVQKNNVRSGR